MTAARIAVLHPVIHITVAYRPERLVVEACQSRDLFQLLAELMHRLQVVGGRRHLELRSLQELLKPLVHQARDLTCDEIAGLCRDARMSRRGVHIDACSAAILLHQAARDPRCTCNFKTCRAQCADRVLELRYQSFVHDPLSYEIRTRAMCRPHCKSPSNGIPTGTAGVVTTSPSSFTAHCFTFRAPSEAFSAMPAATNNLSSRTAPTEFVTSAPFTATSATSFGTSFFENCFTQFSCARSASPTSWKSATMRFARSCFACIGCTSRLMRSISAVVTSVNSS